MNIIIQDTDTLAHIGLAAYLRQRGTSSFFPENWSNAKIKEEVEFAIANNHGKVVPDDPTDNLHFGFSKDGTVEIQFYYNADGSIGSYFPKKR